MLAIMLPAVVLGTLGGSVSADAQAPPPFELTSDGHDANGFLLNPRWRTDDHPRTLDPANRCGILGLRGAPGFRPVLLRDPGCFGQGQRQILRLNEARSLVVGGAVCGQAVNDGSPQGHLNWMPVTMEGTLMFNNKMRVGGDFDLTFEFVGDHRAPSTRWNGSTALWSKLEDTVLSPLHLEFDYRETTDRLPDDPEAWWTRFSSAAEVSPDSANAMLGIGRAVVTGLFNLDLVHYGHSEIHPVFGLAILIESETVARQIRHRWAFLARDRGNQGNCAAPGAIPFRLAESPDGVNRYRVRLGTPEGVSGPPTILKDHSWVARSNGDVLGPEFKWSPNEGLQVEVQWPRPTPTLSRNANDALIMGDFLIAWPMDPTDRVAGAFAEDLGRAVTLRTRTLALDELGPEADKKRPETPNVVPDTGAAQPGVMRRWPDWDERVDSVGTLPAAPQASLIPAEIFGRRPPVVGCSDPGVRRSENPRCIGNWSIAPLLGVNPQDSPFDRNLTLGVSLENVRHYLGGPVLRFRYSLGYIWRAFEAEGDATRSEHLINAQVDAVLGPVRKFITVYGIVSPGLGLARTERWRESFMIALGGGTPIRTGYQIGMNLEVVRVFRTGGPDYVGLGLRVPVAAF